MVVGNAYDDDFSWWLATCVTDFLVVGNAYDCSWWLATHMIFHGAWQRICFFMMVGNVCD